MHMNHKRLRRLYAEERLHVSRRSGRERALGTRAPLALPQPGPHLRRATGRGVALPEGLRAPPRCATRAGSLK